MMLGWLFTGLFAFLIFLIPGVDFIGQVLGGTIQNIDQLLLSLGGGFSTGGGALGYVLATGVELVMFNLYPLSWIISYRIDDALTVFLMIIPWIISGFLVGLARVQNPKQGLKIGLLLITCNSIWCVVLLILIPNLLAGLVPAGLGINLGSWLNAFAVGATDLPMGVSAILVQVEGGAFFIGMTVLMGIIKEGKYEGTL